MSDFSFIGGLNRHGRADSISSSSSVGSGLSPFPTFSDIGSPPTPGHSPTSVLFPHPEHVSHSHAQDVEVPVSPPRRSRNDIFSQSWKVAAPHVRPVGPLSTPPPLPVKAPTPEATPYRRRESKDSGFSFISSGSSIPSSPTSVYRPPPTASTWSPSRAHDTPPQLHPAFSFESKHSPTQAHVGGLRSGSPIIPSTSVLLRLHPHPRYLLGEGGHASVYLASFKASDPSATAVAGGRWRLCAAKRPHADREDNAANLREAAILQRLGALTGLRGSDPARQDHCPWIINLHAVKDEQDEQDTARTPSIGPSSIGVGRPPPLRDATLRDDFSNAHLRSFSASEALVNNPLDRQTGRLRVATAVPALSVIASSPLTPEPTTMNGGLSGMSSPSSAPSTPAACDPRTVATAGLDPSYFIDKSNPAARQSLPVPMIRRGTSLETLTHLGATLASSRGDEDPASAAARFFSADPPRLVLLLEYCPGGTLFDFVRTSPERVGRGRWSGWAKQLASAVAWCKKSGVVIADLKPQNVLVCSLSQ